MGLILIINQEKCQVAVDAKMKIAVFVWLLLFKIENDECALEDLWWQG